MQAKLVVAPVDSSKAIVRNAPTAAVAAPRPVSD
jgi:hypothetical protein